MGRVEEPDRRDLSPCTHDGLGLLASKVATYQGLQNPSIMRVVFEIPTCLRSSNLCKEDEEVEAIIEDSRAYLRTSYNIRSKLSRSTIHISSIDAPSCCGQPNQDHTNPMTCSVSEGVLPPVSSARRTSGPRYYRQRDQPWLHGAGRDDLLSERGDCRERNLGNRVAEARRPGHGAIKGVEASRGWKSRDWLVRPRPRRPCNGTDRYGSLLGGT